MLEYVSKNWLRLLLASRGSLSPGVPRRVFAFGLIAAAAAIYDRYAHTHLRLPVGLQEAGGAVVALVLAFRVNTAYARFWEGRFLWGGLVNAARSAVRVFVAHAKEDRAVHDAFTKWVVVFAHATRLRVRDEPLAPDIAHLLPQSDVDAAAGAIHSPLYAAQRLSNFLEESIAQQRIDPIMAGRCERQIAALVDTLGGIERIRLTPTPLGIVILIERFVAGFLATLPFALLGKAGVWTPLLTMLISYPVLMIDALGSELDDPFGHNANDLPLTRICRNIERDLLGVKPPSAPKAVVAQVD
jgi:putative membrane protein